MSWNFSLFLHHTPSYSMIFPKMTWFRTFLQERPSVSLSLFRVAVAITVGCHIIPSLFQLADNYLATSFREYNGSFFPLWALRAVDAGPDWVVWAFVWLFAFSWGSFLVGFRTQLAAIVMTASCYFFYARNSLHIGTLSFDILLVTLSLVWVVPYYGDWLSVDAFLRGQATGYATRRPFFIQRLLQLQITWTFWYTCLSKITAGGNWLTDLPYYYLMHYPPLGVVRHFPGREFLAAHPAWCQAIQVGVIICELVMPLLWWFRRTRVVGLVLGVTFQWLLLMTLHVPTIFFFLFPAQMMLFIEPERVVAWIERQREQQMSRGRATLLFDGQCGFCQASVKRLLALDLFGYLNPVDFHTVPNVAALHPRLSPERCKSRMQLIEPKGRLSEGFFSVRNMSLRMPLLWPLAPLLWLPGMGRLGQRAYDWVAARRFLFHRRPACATNQCTVIEHATGVLDTKGKILKAFLEDKKQERNL